MGVCWLSSFVEIVLVLCMMSDFWLEPGQLRYYLWDSVSSLKVGTTTPVLPSGAVSPGSTLGLSWGSWGWGYLLTAVQERALACDLEGAGKPLVFTDYVEQCERCATCYQMGEAKGRGSCMASLTPQPGVGASSQPGEGGGLQIFLEVCLEWDHSCITVFSQGCPYPDPLIRQSRLLLELTAMPVGISGPSTCPALSLRKSKDLSPCHPWSWGFCHLLSAFHSLGWLFYV